MRLVGSELLKIWTAPRTLLGILIAELAIVALATATSVHSAANDSLLPDNLERDLIGISGTAVFFAVLLGVLIVTTEYRHGTITTTFLAAPQRERVIGAKTVAAAIGSVVLVAPALALTFAIAVPWVGQKAGFHIGGHELVLMLRLFLGAAVAAVLGLSIGAALGRQLGAIILILGWLIFIEPAIGGLRPATRDYLAGHGALGGILGTGGSDFPSFWKAGVVAAAYLAVLGAAALVVTRRRDIT
jgi:ABC-2 type transport system permease protein